MDVASLLTENILQGFILGVLFGVIFQFSSKYIQMFLLIEFILFKWLEARNIIIVDWNRMTFGLLEGPELLIGQAQTLFDSLVEMGIFGVSLVAGFLIGRRLKK